MEEQPTSKRLENRAKEFEDYELELKKENENLLLCQKELEIRVKELEKEIKKGKYKDISYPIMGEKAFLLQKKIAENMTEGVCLVQISNGKIIYTNTRFEKMFGYEAGELTNKHVSIINAPGEKGTDEVLNEIISSLKVNLTWSGKVHNIKKDGTSFWCSKNISTFNHPDCGQVWISFSKDITGHLFAEQTSKRDKEALQESEKMSRLMLQTIPSGLFTVDIKRKITSWNKKAEKIIGLSAEKVIGKSCLEILKCDKCMKECMLFDDKAEKPIYEIKCAIPIDGKEIIISKNIEVFKDLKGNIVGGLESFIDITDRKKAKEELRIAKEKAEESDRLKSAFLANMSHEIRTPMNAIIGFTQLLKKPDLSEEKKEKYQDIIETNGQVLLNLIDNLIDISKIEAGQMTVDKIECSVNKILKDLYSTYNEYKKNEGKKDIEIRLKKNMAMKDITIMSDEFRLRQILEILIGNAIKYTDSGYIEFGFTLIDSETLQFYVQDTGEGIPEEKLELIFGKFNQALSTKHKTQGGTGLGLAISKNLVKILGGEMWAESTFGKGSTFFFTIPYNPLEKPDDSVQPGLIKNDIESWQGKTILIAEDEDDNYLYIQEALSETKATLLRTTNGIETIEICKTKNVDLVLMDIKIPGIDGYEATRQIKQFNKDILIIAQTAYALSEDRKKSIDAGCDDYISKPFDLTTLLLILDKYLRDK